MKDLGTVEDDGEDVRMGGAELGEEGGEGLLRCRGGE